jgi:hypothetical protein
MATTGKTATDNKKRTLKIKDSFLDVKLLFHEDEKSTYATPNDDPTQKISRPSYNKKQEFTDTP